MEFVLEVIMEFIMEVWLAIANQIIPTNGSKKKERIARIIAAIIILYVFTAFYVGVIMMDIGLDALAAVLLTSSILIFLLQIILGIIFYIKKKKK